MLSHTNKMDDSQRSTPRRQRVGEEKCQTIMHQTFTRISVSQLSGFAFCVMEAVESFTLWCPKLIPSQGYREKEVDKWV